MAQRHIHEVHRECLNRQNTVHLRAAMNTSVVEHPMSKTSVEAQHQHKGLNIVDLLWSNTHHNLCNRPINVMCPSGFLLAPQYNNIMALHNLLLKVDDGQEGIEKNRRKFVEAKTQLFCSTTRRQNISKKSSNFSQKHNQNNCHHLPFQKAFPHIHSTLMPSKCKSI